MMLIESLSWNKNQKTLQPLRAGVWHPCSKILRAARHVGHIMQFNAMCYKGPGVVGLQYRYALFGKINKTKEKNR